ncbi:MAG: ribonuclease P protein component [Chloroflexi bacterium RBG_16_57_8]|nr:MAG: ribonuclease P protein component [Chloroflexi bacterium RBG_16_57_8]
MRGEQHLTRPQQFELVYGRGSSWASGPVVVKALPNGLGFSRYGFSVSRRVGNAVIRNLIKRRLREILRAILLKPGWDIVLIARPSAVNAGYAGLREAVQHLLTRAHLMDMASFSKGLAGES